MIEQLEADIANLMQQAEQADRQGSDEGGQHLPRELAHRQQLREKLSAARAQLKARAGTALLGAICALAFFRGQCVVTREARGRRAQEISTKTR